MTCDLAEFRARVGLFYTRALRLSTYKLSFLTACSVRSFLLLIIHGPTALVPALFLFMTHTDHLSKLSLSYKLDVSRHTHVSIVNPYSRQVGIARMHLHFIVTITILMLIQLAGDVHPNPGPTGDFVSASGLSIVHLNARSLRYKLPLVQCELKSVDIITISETWFSGDIGSDDLIINGFHPPVRRDRPGDPHGGVAIYIKSNLICKPRPDLSVPFLEAVWIETKLDQDTLLVGSLYRPPDANVGYWDLIDQSIQLAGNTPHKYIVLGDLNADCASQPPPRLQDIISTNNILAS